MQSFTTSDGVRISFQDSGGDGIPLVMLHGWQQSQEAFRHQRSDPPETHRAITMDFRGHGRSGKPHHGYRIARLAMDVAELMDHLELAQVDALGWSMGASVWWSFIDLFGAARLRRLVLVDQPSAISRSGWRSEQEHVESGALFDVATIEMMIGGLLGPQDDEQLRAGVRAACAGELAPELIDFMVGEMRRAPGYATAPLLYDHCAQDWRDVLPRIDVPTLVIGCEGSHVPPDSQRYVAAQIPGARVHVFPKEVAGSHFPFLQNPRAFNDVLGGFLGEELPSR